MGRALNSQGVQSHSHSPSVLGPHLDQRRAPSPSSLHCRHRGRRAPGSGLPGPPDGTARLEAAGTVQPRRPVQLGDALPARCIQAGGGGSRRDGQGGGSGPTQPHARATPSRPGPTPSSATPPGWAQFRRSPRAEPLRAPHLLLPGSG